MVANMTSLFQIMTLGAAVLVPAHAQHAVNKPAASQAASVLHKRISLSIHGGDVVEALRKVFDAAGANYVISPNVTGKTTANLKDVPFQIALAALIRASKPHLILRFDGSVYSVEAEVVFDTHGFGPDFGPAGPWVQQDHKLQLNFVKASTVAARLRAFPMFGPQSGTRIVVHEPDNTLIVNVPNSDLDRDLKEHIRLMDIAPLQAKVTF